MSQTHPPTAIETVSDEWLADKTLSAAIEVLKGRQYTVKLDNLGMTNLVGAVDVTAVEPGWLVAVLTELLSRRSLDTAGVEGNQPETHADRAFAAENSPEGNQPIARYTVLSGGYMAGPDRSEVLDRSVGAWVRYADHLTSRPTRNAEVGVKELTWMVNGVTSIWTGELLFGVYYTIVDESTGWRVFRQQFLSEASETEVAYVASVEAAKAAAQADFDTRIRSALAITEPEREPVAWRWTEKDGDTGGLTDREDIAEYAKVQGWDVEPLCLASRPTRNAETVVKAVGQDARAEILMGIAATLRRTAEMTNAPFQNFYVAQAEACEAGAVAITLASPPSPAEVTPTHRLVKRGSEYVLIGIGKMQSTNWLDCDPGPKVPWGSGKFVVSGKIHAENVDMREVAIYRSATDPAEIWVRPREEFEDGRFEVLQLGKEG